MLHFYAMFIKKKVDDSMLVSIRTDLFFVHLQTHTEREISFCCKTYISGAILHEDDYVSEVALSYAIRRVNMYSHDYDRLGQQISKGHVVTYAPNIQTVSRIDSFKTGQIGTYPIHTYVYVCIHTHRATYIQSLFWYEYTKTPSRSYFFSVKISFPCNSRNTDIFSNICKWRQFDRIVYKSIVELELIY